MDLQELLNEREFRTCRGPDEATTEELLAAFTYFCTKYWHIKHPERGRIRFEMREAQIETVRVWMSNRYSVALKARQIGFSTLGAAYAFWLVFFRPDRFVVMLSRTEREAAKLLQKAKYGYKMMPQWMRLRGPEQTSDNLLKMTFANESAIESLPSGNDPARGESVYLVIVDEWAFLPNPEEAWAAIEPVADVGGRVIGLSTANGSGTFFHQLWVGAETRTNNFKPIFWPWSAGDRDQAWYDSKVRSMPSWQLHQEYPTTAEEAFIKSGNPVFDVDKLLQIETVEPDRGYVHVLSKKHIEFRLTPDGEMAVWEEPAPDQVYALAADVAEGLGYGDYSSIHVFNARTQLVVAHWHGHIEPDLFGHLIAEIGWWYNGCLCGVEVNNHGLTTIKAMQSYGYKNIYKTRRLAAKNPTPMDQYGWRTTVASKPLAIDELAGSIREGAITLLDAPTIAELKTFVRDQNGKMHGSPHDDRVMSLAIAHQMLKHVWLPEFKAEVVAPKYSISWWAKMMADDNLATKRVPIGAYNARNG